MECTKLLNTGEKFGYTGCCISPEKSQLLKISLLILQKENHFQKIFYWGTINGLENDYDIAYGYKKDCLKDLIFFYSLDGLTWLLLPKANKCNQFLTSVARTLFEGNPSTIINIYDMNPPFPPDEDASEFFSGPVPQLLKEEDRLSATIELIIDESWIIPRGAWHKHPDGVITENVSFEGLNSLESLDLKSYLHARGPKMKWNLNLLTRNDYNYSLDFLDPCNLDVPTDCWNIQRYLGGRLSVLQNLYWPGMTFYHIIESPHYGSLYIGNGLKNFDAPFML